MIWLDSDTSAYADNIHVHVHVVAGTQCDKVQCMYMYNMYMCTCT